MTRKKNHGPKIYLGVLLILMYLPILVIIVYSFNVSKTSTIWGGVTIAWYQKLFEDQNLLDALVNSVVLGGLSALAAGLIGTIGAVGMTKARLKSKGLVEYFSTLPLMTPEIILGMILMVFFSFLGLPFGMLTLVIAHTTFCIPYVFMLVKARLVGLDPSYLEAAQDLGASQMRAFCDITLPLIAPAIISGMLLSFAMSLDDVVISIFVTGATTNTLPIMIYTQLKTGITPEINALCAIQLVVTLLLVAFAGLISRQQNAKVEMEEK